MLRHREKKLFLLRKSHADDEKLCLRCAEDFYDVGKLVFFEISVMRSDHTKSDEAATKPICGTLRDPVPTAEKEDAIAVVCREREEGLPRLDPGDSPSDPTERNENSSDAVGEEKIRTRKDRTARGIAFCRRKHLEVRREDEGLFSSPKEKSEQIPRIPAVSRKKREPV